MSERVAAVLLAGGMARRMGGGDKARIELAGRPLIAHVIDRVRPQVEAMLVNANGDPDRFADLGLPVRSDRIEGHAGPLAGILTGMCWVREIYPEIRWLLSVPVDTPFLPVDLAERLMMARKHAGTPLACAVSNGRTHPVAGLFDVALADDLERAMLEEDMRKIDLWTARHGVAEAGFATVPFDPFFNVNRPSDLAEAEGMASVVGQRHRSGPDSACE